MTPTGGQSASQKTDSCDCGDSCTCGGEHDACTCGGHPTPANRCDCGEENDSCTCGEHDACSCGGESATVCAMPNHAHSSAHSCSCQSVKLPRKIHAASGAVFGVFLIAHLLLNTSALGTAHFRSTIDFVHSIIHALPGITLIIVFIPLLIQICTGLYLVYKDGLKYTPNGCTRGSKPRFFLQRVTGLVILAFVILHLGTLHDWSFAPVIRDAAGPLAGYNPHHLFPAAGWITGILYLICVWGVSYHLANGAITGTMVWGVVKQETARLWLRRACAVAGVLLAIFGTLAWFAFKATGLLA